MSDNKITQDQLEPNVMEELESGIGDLSTLSTENKDSLVAAVTEIYGKNVIAEAIGEPLAVTDTFSEMGSEINSLLSSFKTNMMNSGVTVESGDKFKQLIEKIKGLTEGEGNKGIKYAEGIIDVENVTLGNDKWLTYEIPYNIDFDPTILLICISKWGMSSTNKNDCILVICDKFSNSEDTATRFKVPNMTETYLECYITNTTSTGCTLNYYMTSSTWDDIGGFSYVAIGVGEEDNTLRDSLASILEEEGVNVTEEDDMASLISKVDEEFDRKNANSGLDIISATKLPATGRENQICVITDVEPSNFIITTDFTDVDFTSNDIFVYQGTSIAKDLSFGTKVAITNDKVTNNQYFCKVCQGTDRLDSYIYQNNLWNQLTVSKILLYENYKFYNSSVFGSITSSQSTEGKFYWDSSTHITRSYNGSYYASKVFNKKIDFSLYNKIEVLAYKNHSDSTSLTFGANKNVTSSDGTSMPTLEYSKSNTISSTSIKSYEYDISSWTGEYYLTMVGGKAGGFVITAIYIY